jgi:cell division protein FtsQ
MTAPPSLGRRALTAAAGLIAMVALAAGVWYGYRAATSQPLKRVVFAGDVDRLSHADLDALSAAIQAAPPGSVPLASVREAARRVPWVREATVRRQFPDAVEITFEAHEAFARWNDRQLLSRRGEAFTAEAAGAELPRLRGPDGAGPAMVAEYGALVKTLAPLGSPLAELRLSARGAWQAVLASGMVLELGRADMNARAQRFVAAWPQAAARAPDTRYADLRYPNGFALGTDPGSRASGPSAVSAIPKENKKK